ERQPGGDGARRAEALQALSRSGRDGPAVPEQQGRRQPRVQGRQVRREGHRGHLARRAEDSRAKEAMSRRPISPGQRPMAQRRGWQADPEAEANCRLLRLFRASRPEEPAPDAWERSLTRIEWALLALPAPVATGSVATIRRERS